MATYDSLTDSTAAGALATEDVASTIIAGLPAQSAALRTFRRVNMTKSQQRMPVLSALPVAYWVTGDTGLKQTSEMAWGNKYLDVRELAVIVPVPINVIEDSDFDIAGEAVPRLIEAFGAKLDAATLMNVDNPWPETYQKGIVRQAFDAGNYHTEGTSAAPHDDFAGDISDTFAEVEEDGFDVNVVYARRKVRARLRNLRDDNGNPIYQPVAQGNPATIYGEQLEFVAGGPWVNNYELVAGDRNAAILGVRKDFEFEVFTQGVISDDSGNVVLNLMQQDAIAIRAVGRFAFAVANPINAEGVGDSTRFPFAVLVNAGS